MANVLAELFQNTADAIREKTGDTGTMKPAEFPEKIRAIETGGGGGGVANIIPLTITENGKYNVADGVDGYAPVTVNVENKIPDGYIKPTGTVQITENGTVDVSAYANAEVSVPTGGGAANLVSLVVTENGAYRSAKNFNPLSDWAYRMKPSYTQEYLSALYTKASVLGTFPLNEFTTAASMIDNHDGNVLMALCFSLNGYTFYGLMIECDEPKFWVSAEVANALAQGSEGWYAPLDATGMNFAPSDTPKYPWVAAATAVISIEEISMLFVYDDFDGYASVDVDVQPKLMQLNVTENGSYTVPFGIDGYHYVTVDVPKEGGTFAPKVATGTFTPLSMDEPITVEHNLGVTPDIVVLQLRYQFTASTIPSLAGYMFTSTGFCKAISDAIGIGQCIQTMFDKSGQLLYSSMLPSANIESSDSEYSQKPIHSATTTTITFGGGACRLVTDGGGVGGDLYSWTAIGGLVPR